MHTAATLWVTPRGLRKLREERADLTHWLDRLRTRLRNTKLLRLQEQSLARAEQTILNHRLQAVDMLLGRTQALPETWGHKREVRTGDTVYLRHHESIRALTLVNVWSADPRHGKVSVISPLGQALLGRSLGARVPLATLDGTLTYEILKII